MAPTARHRRGLLADLFGHGCGIVSSEQHTDAESSIFYQRIVFDYAKKERKKTHNPRQKLEGSETSVHFLFLRSISSGRTAGSSLQ